MIIALKASRPIRNPPDRLLGAMKAGALQPPPALRIMIIPLPPLPPIGAKPERKALKMTMPFALARILGGLGKVSVLNL